MLEIGKKKTDNGRSGGGQMKKSAEHEVVFKYDGQRFVVEYDLYWDLYDWTIKMWVSVTVMWCFRPDMQIGVSLIHAFPKTRAFP